MHFTYSILIWIYGLLIKTSSIWNQKSRDWISGRQKQHKNFKSSKSDFHFHLSSLGELEQAKPIIEKILAKRFKVSISFFSPSGFNKAILPSGVISKTYLPLDTPSNAKRYLEQIDTKALVFVKYDLWFNLIHYAQEKKIKTFLISAIIRNSSWYLNDRYQWFKTKMKKFDSILVQDEESLDILKKRGFTNGILAGDSRIDQVQKISKSPYSNLKVQEFAKDSKLFIAGSTWQKDEELIKENLEAILSFGYKIIIAPHEPNERNLSRLKKKFPLATFLSEEEKSKNVLIVDSIGILSKLYRFGSIAYVGGGFKKEIHNILEPTIYKIPVIVGPKLGNFVEAQELKELSCLFSVKTAQEFKTRFQELNKERIIDLIRDKLAIYYNSKLGVSEKIVNELIKDF